MRYALLLLLLASANAYAASSETLRPTGYLAVAIPKAPKRVILEGGWLGVLERRGSESTYKGQNAWFLRGGLALNRADIYYEYSKFIDKTGEGTVSIHRTQHMQLAWYRRRLRENSKGAFWFIAGGLGLQRENIRTTLASETALNDGVYYALLGISGGGMILIGDFVEFGTELRILSSENFRPNPTIGAAFTLGVRL